MGTQLSQSALSALPNHVSTPSYDRNQLSAGILHIGLGNFHRAHQAIYLDRLFETGENLDWAITGASLRENDIAQRADLEKQNWLTTVVELDPQGLTARICGSMIDYVKIEPAAVINAMCDPAIRIVSLTITEGGYFVDEMTGGLDTNHPDIKQDVENPDEPKTVFGCILLALRKRLDAGIAPFTIMSCDNLPENGHVAKTTTYGLAQLQSQSQADWIEKNVAFPNGMVDCITPATSQRERKLVSDKFGIEDARPVVCEPFRQWVLEDNFPSGRPALEKVGVEFVKDVAPYELMKLRILNGGHAAIAYPAGLLGIHYVHDAMANPMIVGFLGKLQREEIIPTVPAIENVSFEAYSDTVIERFSNEAIGDTIPRLCLDGSNRQPKFILPTLAESLNSGGSIKGLALEIALWCRYCAGVDEAGNAIQVEDENADLLKTHALQAKEDPNAFLGITKIFGDLGQDARLKSEFKNALNSLWTKGVEATLKDYIES